MNKKYSFLKKNFLILKYVFKFCKGLVYFAVLNIIVNVVLAISKVLIISKAIESIVTTSSIEDVYDLYKAIAIYLAIIIVCTTIKQIYNNYIHPRYQTMYQKNIQRFLFSKVSKIDMASYDDPIFFDKFSRGLSDSSWRGFRVFSSLTNFITSISVSIAVGTYAIISDVYLFLIIVASSILSVITIVIINKRYYKLDYDCRENWRYYWYVNRTFYQERFASELKTTDISDALINKYKQSTDNIITKIKKHQKKLIFPECINNFASTVLTQGGTYIYLGYRLFNNFIKIETFSASINAALIFASNFSSAFSTYAQLKQHALYIDDFLWILEYKPEIEKREGKKIDFNFEKLDLKNVKFNYPSVEKSAINDLSITIKRKQKIAIVGDNGSGKTTLMKLLLKFYNPTNGEILLNGINYNTFNEESIRKLYSIVFQDFQIYALSIAQNVLMRKLENEYDEQLVWTALEKVGLKEKIASFPDGINTQITKEFDKNGENFSGGEKQRLAIARVFASDADIYILDEPTASLDPLSEERINKLIIKNSDKTMIIIAHRLSTVVDADIIYLIKEGRVEEKGSHSELMNNNKNYAKMFNTQKELYKKHE